MLPSSGETCAHEHIHRGPSAHDRAKGVGSKVIGALGMACGCVSGTHRSMRRQTSPVALREVRPQEKADDASACALRLTSEAARRTLSHTMLRVVTRREVTSAVGQHMPLDSPMSSVSSGAVIAAVAGNNDCDAALENSHRSGGLSTGAAIYR